jgi:hypothetical protein
MPAPPLSMPLTSSATKSGANRRQLAFMKRNMPPKLSALTGPPCRRGSGSAYIMSAKNRPGRPMMKKTACHGRGVPMIGKLGISIVSSQ